VTVKEALLFLDQLIDTAENLLVVHARESTRAGVELRGPLPGTSFVVDVEDDVVAGRAANMEVERGALLQLVEEVGWLAEAH
jgi:hypothetical protein